MDVFQLYKGPLLIPNLISFLFYSSSSTMQSSQWNLANLPNELQLHVASFLSPVALQCLALTNRHFNNLLEVPEQPQDLYPQRAYRLELFELLRTWIPDQFHLCRSCLRFKAHPNTSRWNGSHCPECSVEPTESSNLWEARFSLGF
jgi:hypothetical protein